MALPAANGGATASSSGNTAGTWYQYLNAVSSLRLNAMPLSPSIYAPGPSFPIDTPPVLPAPVSLPLPAYAVSSPAPLPIHTFYQFQTIIPSNVSLYNASSLVAQQPYFDFVKISETAAGGVQLGFSDSSTLDYGAGQVTEIDLTLNGYPGTVNVQSLPAGVTVNISGVGSNTLIGPTAIANTWKIAGPNSGTLDGVVTFAGVGNLQGGGTDDFQFLPGGSVSGNLDGAGGGNDVLDYSQRTDSIFVNAQTGQASEIASTFVNISNFVGSQATNNLFTGTDDNGTWTFAGTGGQFQTSNQTFTFSSFQVIQGGAADDTYIIESTAGPGLAVYTGTGTDSVTVTPTSQNLANVQAPLSIIGQGKADPLTIDDQADAAAGLGYTIYAGSVLTSVSAAIDYGGMTSLLFNAGGGPSGAVANVESTGSPTPVTVDAHAGSPLTVNVSPTDEWLGGGRSRTDDRARYQAGLIQNQRDGRSWPWWSAARTWTDCKGGTD